LRSSLPRWTLERCEGSCRNPLTNSSVGHRSVPFGIFPETMACRYRQHANIRGRFRITLARRAQLVLLELHVRAIASDNRVHAFE
jgi:hypothetical protein